MCGALSCGWPPAGTQLLRYHCLMRDTLLLLLVCFATAAAAQPQTTHETLDAVWSRRTLRHFVHPLEVNSINGPLQSASCDQIYRDLTDVLVQLGARQRDIRIDQRGCHVPAPLRSMDATFRALTPLDPTAKPAPRQVVQAHWKIVALKGDCVYLKYITHTVLPLFATRNNQGHPALRLRSAGRRAVYAGAGGGTLISIQQALERLAGNPIFRVLRRLDPQAVGGPPLASGNFRRAAIVDTETTGMDPQESR